MGAAGDSVGKSYRTYILSDDVIPRVAAFADVWLPDGGERNQAEQGSRLEFSQSSRDPSAPR
jgi:hypothetical protein